MTRRQRAYAEAMHRAEQIREEKRAADEVAELLDAAGEVIGIPLAAQGHHCGGSVSVTIDHEAAGNLARFLIDRHGG